MMTKFARQSCAFFLSRLTVEVDRLKEVSFPGHDPKPRLWVALISGLLDTALEYVEKSKYESSLAEQLKLICEAERLGEMAYDFIDYLSGAHSDDIPNQVVGPFKHWAENLEIKNTIFFRARHCPNYEISTADFYRSLRNINNQSISLTTALKNISWPVQMVTVPSHAMGMLPHFAVVAHELGHAVQDRVDLDLRTYAGSVDECEQRIRSRIGSSYGAEERSNLAKILYNWVDELNADAVGFLITGPAYYFALMGFLELSGHTYGICNTHPPSDLRQELLFDRIEEGKLSYAAVYEEHTGQKLSKRMNSPHVPSCPNPDILFQLLTEDGINEAEAAILVELVPLAREMANEIFKSASIMLKKLKSDITYTPMMYADDLNAHLNPLTEFIPPIEVKREEVTRPTSLACILNVGWVAMLSKLDKFPRQKNGKGDDEALQIETLHELLLKALELSEIKRLWDRRR
jgi:hypothetical protein